jgi:superfamily I DNA/RNA helicase
MGEATQRRGLYLAFNRSVADYASRLFPSNVECRTIHSLAFRQMRSEFKAEEKLIGSTNRNQVASLLSVQDLQIGSQAFADRQVASLVLATLKVFMHSGDSEIKSEHMPMWGILCRLSDSERKKAAEIVCQYARRLWQMMINPQDRTPLGHDGYLKLWALGRPKLQADFILLDEAQDSNPVMLDVLSRQGAQVIYVGDRHQQIYQWRGAVNAMEQVRTSHETYLTQSFRFGAIIANLANHVLKRLGEETLLVGNPNVKSKIGNATANAIITRTNAMLVGMVVRELENEGRPYVEGGTQELLRLLEGVSALQRNHRCDQPEFFGFKNWREFQEFANSDEGAEWRMLVGLVEEYTVDELIKTLSSVAENPRESTVILSTTHKAKGREWDHVELADDFNVEVKEKDEPLNDYEREEMRIMYVALTRAKQSLFVPEELLAKIMNRKPSEKPTDKMIRIKTKKKKTDLDGPVAKPTSKRKS